MITEDKVTEIFCIADDFCKVFDAQMAKKIRLRQKESANITVKAFRREAHISNNVDDELGTTHR